MRNTAVVKIRTPLLGFSRSALGTLLVPHLRVASGPPAALRIGRGFFIAWLKLESPAWARQTLGLDSRCNPEGWPNFAINRRARTAAPFRRSDCGGELMPE